MSKNEDIGSVLTETEITRLINEKACKVSLLAKELGFKPDQIKNHIFTTMGDRIKFTRGRNGGVQWSNQE